MSRGSFTFSLYETKQLIQGKFQFRPCLECGCSGIINVAGDGTVLNGPVCDGGYVVQCDECNGLRGYLVFEDDL